jgi:hypothetical protein
MAHYNHITYIITKDIFYAEEIGKTLESLARFKKMNGKSFLRYIGQLPSYVRRFPEPADTL